MWGMQKNMKKHCEKLLESACCGSNRMAHVCYRINDFSFTHNGDKNMNLDTLIEILNDYREEHGGDAEVRLMTQQNWPFENRICGVTTGQEMNDTDDEDEATTIKTLPTKTLSTSSKVARSATAANGLGKHVAIADRDTAMRWGKILENLQNLFPFGLMRFEPHGSCVTSQMHISVQTSLGETRCQP